MRYLLMIAALVLPTAGATAETPCTEAAPCQVEGGDYLLSFPPDWDGVTALPSLVFFHGHNASAVSTVRSGGVRRSFVDRGYLLIAPNGAQRASGVRSFPARPGFGGGRNDIAFTMSILEDVAKRVPLDKARVAVSGFSAGGSMAWMMGCYAGSHFSAVLSVAGALRRENPSLCPDPVARGLQVHGFADAQVPHEGRAIRDWHQGDVHETMALMRRSLGCRSNPTAINVGTWRSRVWDRCERGNLAYLEHDGGHGLPRGWSDIAREWLETGTLTHK